MQVYEYKIVPAPIRGEKAKGARSTQERLALALTHLLNSEARDGWEFLRTECLPTEERTGFTKRTTVNVNLLVLRRPYVAGASLSEETAAAEHPRPLLSFGRLGRKAPATPPLQATPATEGKAPRLGPASLPGDSES